MHKFLFYNKFIIRLYMFREPCAYHLEVKIVLYSIWYHHTCRWPSGAQVERGHGKKLVTPVVQLEETVLWVKRKGLRSEH